MSDTALLLSEIDPQLAANLNADEGHVVVGTATCGDCKRTVKKLGDGGVQVTTHVIPHDPNHPIIVTVKKHLGVDSIHLPIVFKRGVLAWTGMNLAAIVEETRAQRNIATAVA